MTSTSQMRESFRKVLDWARTRWLRVRYYMKLVAPCWLAALITFAISMAMLHPQTVDALAALAEERGFYSQRHLAVLITLLIFSSSVWYITRALMYVRYDSGPGNFEKSKNHLRVVKWLPRILGVLPIVAVSLAFLRSRSFLFVIIYIAISVIFVVILDRRRKWLEATSRKAPTSDERHGMPLDELSPSLPKKTRRVVIGTLIAAFLALILVIASPVMAPSAIGPLGVIFLAGAGWVIAGSALLIYPSRRFRLPSLFVTMLVLAVVFGIWNDNHGITVLEYEDKASAETVNERPALQQHFESWVDHRTADPVIPSSDTPYPVFVVTAEGGGIRAAYWTAAVLNAISINAPDFPCHVFAMSGVSGGSLGAAAYAARLADVYFLSDDRDKLCKTSGALHIERKNDDVDPANNNPGKLAEDAKELRVELEALGQDFLSPVLAGMLFPDLVQSLLPVAMLPDRGSYLERSWESAWTKAWQIEMDTNDAAREFSDRGRTRNEDNRFRQDFLNLWDSDLALLTPSLFLNATRVETGQRVIVSNIRLSNAERQADNHSSTFRFAVDLLDRMGGSVKLSQAVHFSARFTYLSPAATIEDRTTGKSVRIVDGGYFENSGTVTASEMVDVLRGVCAKAKSDRNCQVHVLIVSNDVENPNAWQQDQLGMSKTGEGGTCVCADEQQGCDDEHYGSSDDSHSDPPTATLLTETLSPVRALFATRSARGYLAEEQLFSDMPCLTYRAQLSDIEERAIPLGWILSDSMRSGIEDQATTSPTVAFVAEIVSKYWRTRAEETE